MLQCLTTQTQTSMKYSDVHGHAATSELLTVPNLPLMIHRVTCHCEPHADRNDLVPGYQDVDVCTSVRPFILRVLRAAVD